MDVAVAPVGDRVNLESAPTMSDESQIRATGSLTASEAAEPGRRIQPLEHVLHWPDLVLQVVGAESFTALLPTLSVPRFLPGRAHFAARHTKVQRQAVGNFIDESIRLVEVVAGIDEDDRNARHYPRHQVQHHCRLHAETRRHDVRSRQMVQRAFHALRRAQMAPGMVESVQFEWYGAVLRTRRATQNSGAGIHGSLISRPCSTAATRPERTAKSPKRSPGWRSAA